MISQVLKLGNTKIHHLQIKIISRAKDNSVKVGTYIVAAII